MKTVTNGIVVKRVSNKMAEEYILAGYGYCPKRLYKDSVRALSQVIESGDSAAAAASEGEYVKFGFSSNNG